MTTISSQAPAGVYERPSETMRQEGRVVALPSVAPATTRPATLLDPFEAADAEFDFAAADLAAAQTLRRDMQQLKLAEMADMASQGSVSVQTAAAAYREFEV